MNKNANPDKKNNSTIYRSLFFFRTPFFLNTMRTIRSLYILTCIAGIEIRISCLKMFFFKDFTLIIERVIVKWDLFPAIICLCWHIKIYYCLVNVKVSSQFIFVCSDQTKWRRWPLHNVTAHSEMVNDFREDAYSTYVFFFLFQGTTKKRAFTEIKFKVCST